MVPSIFKGNSVKENIKKVLVVDDSKTVLTIIKNEFEKALEAEIFYAQSYKEAMNIIRRNPHEIKVALVDLDLPDAPNGQIVSLMNSHSIPAVVLTGSDDKSLKETMLKRRVVDYILKNNSSSIFYAAKIVNRILNNYDTTVLVVDDSRSSLAMVLQTLEPLNLKILTASDGVEALKILDNSTEKISLIITDYNMPNMDGLEFVMKVRGKYSKDELAIIAMSAEGNKDVVMDFLRVGANDFISKPFTSEMMNIRANNNLELLELFAKTKDIANKDFLTGAYNRRYFYSAAQRVVNRAKKESKKIALGTIDIDKFKNINDTYGHDVGDVAIKEVLRVLKETLSGSELIARFGGEEFCILIENVDENSLFSLLDGAREAFEKNHFSVGEAHINYTVSIGVYYGEALSIDDMIKHSDESLYVAKNSGRNQVVINR